MVLRPSMPVCILLLLLVSLLGTAQTSSLPPQAGAQPRVFDATPSTSPNLRRVVDTKKFPPKRPWLGRMMLAPFRAMAPGMEHGLANFEEHRMQERIRLYFTKPHVRPLFGGLGDGSGLGGGVYLSTGESIAKSYRFLGTIHATSKRYAETTFGLRASPTTGALKALKLEVMTRYQLRPQEDFWGLGPRAPAERTTYYLQDRGVSLSASVQTPKWLLVGALIDYSAARVFAGKDARYPSTQQVFGSSGLPGLDRGAELVGAGPVVELELRDQPGFPRSGAYLHLSTMSYASTGAADFAFWNHFGDARFYVPLGTRRRVLAFRLLGDFNEPKGNAGIPFFRLARLGDTNTLRGFETYRFHARNAAMTSAEYRYQIMDTVSVFAFTDAGQVFDHLRQLNTANMHVTYGGGLVLHDKKSVLFKLFCGRSDEGTRLFFNFGPTF